MHVPAVDLGVFGSFITPALPFTVGLVEGNFFTQGDCFVLWG